MQAVKFGNDKSLRWQLNRDPSTMSSIKVRFAKDAGDPAVVEKDAVAEADMVIRVDLVTADFGEGKLEIGDYLVEVETTDAGGDVLTHPDDADRPHERLKVLATLGPEG